MACKACTSINTPEAGISGQKFRLHICGVSRNVNLRIVPSLLYLLDLLVSLLVSLIVSLLVFLPIDACFDADIDVRVGVGVGVGRGVISTFERHSQETRDV